MTKRLGSAANAKIAASITYAGGVHDGWKYISSGSYRDAYLGPDGVVYKVQHTSEDGYDDHDCNRAEHQRFAQFGKSWSEDGFRLARCRVFANGVLAMEYVPVGNFRGDRWDHVSNKSSTHPAAARARMWARRNLDAFDVCGDNYIVHAETGELVIVDYAT